MGEPPRDALRRLKGWYRHLARVRRGQEPPVYFWLGAEAEPDLCLERWR